MKTKIKNWMEKMKPFMKLVCFGALVGATAYGGSYLGTHKALTGGYIEVDITKPVEDYINE